MQKIEENNTRLETSSRKLEISREHFMQRWAQQRTENGMDLTEAEDIKKRWQEYTEELYKKDLHYPDNHDGVITDLEPDILEREVKWALRSITTNKANGGDRIPVELFQILKDDAVEESAALNMPAHLENSAVATGLEKVSFHSSAKECSNNCTTALISHASNVMLIILQARLQQYVNRELPDVQAGFEEAEEPETK